MYTCRYLLSIVAVGSYLLLFGVGNAQAQKRVTTPTNSAATPSSTSGAIGELKSIRSILEHADHDYQGHRAKAVREITLAIHALEGGTRHAPLSPQQKAAMIAARQAKAANAGATRSGTTTTQKPLTEPQATSDEQLNTALSLLTQVASQLGNAKPGVSEHLQSAIQELKTALAIR